MRPTKAEGWRHHDLGTADRDYVTLVRYATLAASSHNTQPWKFALEPGRVVILPDLSHRCPAVDPDDAGLEVTAPSPTEFTMGHNVNSAQEVDAVMDQARQAGARIVKPAQRTFWGGYAGYLQDPDGHIWEVVWNPALSVAD